MYEQRTETGVKMEPEFSMKNGTQEPETESNGDIFRNDVSRMKLGTD